MEWAITCAEHVLPLYTREAPDDDRPQQAFAIGRAWIRGEATMRQAHDASFAANAAGRELTDAGRFAALSAGQAVAVAHVAAHDLGAGAYALRAVHAASAPELADAARLAERDWQRAQLPDSVRDQVIED